MGIAWEYRVERFVDGVGELRLCELGAAGWELVAVTVQFTTHYAYLKRQLRK